MYPSIFINDLRTHIFSWWTHTPFRSQTHSLTSCTQPRLFLYATPISFYVLHNTRRTLLHRHSSLNIFPLSFARAQIVAISWLAIENTHPSRRIFVLCCAILFFFVSVSFAATFANTEKLCEPKAKKKKLYGKKFFRLPNQKWKRTRNSFVWGTVGALGARYYGSWMLTLKGTYIVGSVQGIL